MAPTVPTSVPTTIVAGDTLSFDITDYSDYPISAGYALTYAFRYAGGGDVSGTGDLSLDLGASQITQVSSTHQVRVTAAQTATLKAGGWRWKAYLTLGSARYSVDGGTATVMADFASLEAVQTHAERELVLVEAAIMDLTTNNVSTYSLNGRSVTKLDLSTLHRRRTSLLWEISLQANRGLGKTLEVHFGAL